MADDLLTITEAARILGPERDVDLRSAIVMLSRYSRERTFPKSRIEGGGIRVRLGELRLWLAKRHPPRGSLQASALLTLAGPLAPRELDAKEERLLRAILRPGGSNRGRARAAHDLAVLYLERARAEAFGELLAGLVAVDEEIRQAELAPADPPAAGIVLVPPLERAVLPPAKPR